MARAASGDTIVIKPQDNIYTALLAAATAASLFGLIVLFVKANQLVGGLF